MSGKIKNYLKINQVIEFKSTEHYFKVVVIDSINDTYKLESLKLKHIIEVTLEDIEKYYDTKIVKVNLEHTPLNNDSEDKIDYKDLLIKYIEHIVNCEGIDYIDNGVYGDDYEFTDKEKEILLELKKSKQ